MRERYITRTIKSATCTCKIADIDSGTIYDAPLCISASVPPEKRLTVLQETYNTNSKMVIAIVHTEITESVYGMTEEEFIIAARLMPNRRPDCD